jgi:vacuolar protein sorting-associated protein VTA1
VSAPPEPFAGLTDAPSAHFSHELEEPYSTSALPLVSTAFGEEDIPLEIPSAPAPVPINASDVQAQHTVLSVSPSPPPSASILLHHQVDPKTPTEAPLPSIAPYDTPAEMEQGLGQGQDYLMSIDTAPMTPPPTLPQHPSSPTHIDAPPTAPYLAGGPHASAPPLPPPPSAPYMHIPRQPPPPPPPPEPSPPPELTPGLIAKAQRHCRFAISALDYEDAEQARKELHAALAILGG